MAVASDHVVPHPGDHDDQADGERLPGGTGSLLRRGSPSREEIRAVAEGRASREDHLQRRAAHRRKAVIADEWTHLYGREQAALPTAHTRRFEFWPAVARVNNAYGDRNLVCACPPMSEYA